MPAHRMQVGAPGRALLSRPGSSSPRPDGEEGRPERDSSQRESNLSAVGGSAVSVARARRVEHLEAVHGISWSTSISVPQAYRERGAKIPKTEQRGITLVQLSTLADLVQRVLARVELGDAFNHDERIDWDTVNLYHMNTHFVKPLTARFKCSFVEVVAQEAQTPIWFVSHWWGTPFQQTVALLQFHAAEREMPQETPYWICTFANNQHDLSELSGELEATPFVRAILGEECQGTLALLDKGVTTLERIWCVLELHVSTTRARAEKKEHLFDIAAWQSGGGATYGGQPVPAKPTLRMDLGNGRMKETVKDESTGGAFPLMVSAKGATIDILKAKASREEDRQSILHLIAGTPEMEREGVEPPAECASYDQVSCNARRMFASGAMYRAAVQGDGEELQRLLEGFPEQKDEGISDGASPLYAAAWKNNAEALQMLLAARADPDRRKDDGATPVFVAAQAGNKEALKSLLGARANPSLARTGDGVSPLFMAVQKKHVEEVEMLLAAGADVNALTEKGGSPLHLAVQEGSTKVLKALLAGKADPNLVSGNGVTPTMMAHSAKHNGSKIAALLKEAGGKTAQARQPAAPDKSQSGEATGAGSRPSSVGGGAPASLPPPVPPKRHAASRGPPAPRGGQGRAMPFAANFQSSMAAMGGMMDAMGALDYGSLEGPAPPPTPPPLGGGRRRRESRGR